MGQTITQDIISTKGSMSKRIFDFLLVLALIVVLGPVIIVITICLLVMQGAPVLYISERMKTVDKSFRLLKFRTMSVLQGPAKEDSASGGFKDFRITKIGHVLRKKRLDELPQLFNILVGDMSFVGPRPPLRRYTTNHRDVYAEVLKCKPGVTGLASIIFQHHEAYLLAQCKTEEENEKVYVGRCIPRKAKIDLIYQQNQSISLDLYILYLTAARFAPLPGRRAQRIRKSR